MPRSDCDPRLRDDCRLPVGKTCNTTSDCGIAYDENEGIDGADLADRIAAILATHDVRPPRDCVESFGRELAYCIRPRVNPRPSICDDRKAGNMDILGFIGEAQRNGERDEALWRAFLATHFTD